MDWDCRLMTSTCASAPRPSLCADLGLMNLGDLFPTFPTQALSEGGASGAGRQVGPLPRAADAPTSKLPTGVCHMLPAPLAFWIINVPACALFTALSLRLQVSGDLFVMPSLPDYPEASSGAPSHQHRRGRSQDAAGQQGSGGAGGSGARGGGLLMLGADEPDLQLEGLGRYDLELMWVLRRSHGLYPLCYSCKRLGLFDVEGTISGTVVRDVAPLSCLPPPVIPPLL